MIQAEKLEGLLSRVAEIEHRMTQNPDAETFVKLSRDYAELEPLARSVRALQEAEKELSDVEAMLEDPDADGEMRALAEAERAELAEKVEALGKAVKIGFLPRDRADARNVILEVRAGTGGDEAALFAGDLFRMYQRHAQLHGWKVEIVSASEGEVGGFKEVIASVSGERVFERLKFESGVHRVQRVPATESGGRIHTSAATVAVLPQAGGG